MSANDVVTIFNQLSSLNDQVDINWSQGNFGPWVASYNILTWPISVQQNASALIYDYYLVQIEGAASFTSTADWRLDSHSIDVVPRGDVSKIELIETSPSTTIGSTSYTTGITTTLGGSVGFSGSGPSFSVNASVSLNNSTTKSISDLQIENVSMLDMTPAINSAWRFIVAPDQVDEVDTPINVEFLYRTPHGTGLNLTMCFSIYLAGGAPDEINALINNGEGQQALSNGTDKVFMISGFEGQKDRYLSGKARFEIDRNLTLTSPPAPKN